MYTDIKQENYQVITLRACFKTAPQGTNDLSKFNFSTASTTCSSSSNSDTISIISNNISTSITSSNNSSNNNSSSSNSLKLALSTLLGLPVKVSRNNFMYGMIEQQQSSSTFSRCQVAFELHTRPIHTFFSGALLHASQ